MRLKRLYIHGFKTFAPKTELLFGEGLTAIVGPNGAGKSNVADAVRWVLGEQSLGQLRAKRTEDLIFAGSSTRAPEKNPPRLSDLASELEPQVRRMERQARQAQEYINLQHQLHDLLETW